VKISPSALALVLLTVMMAKARPVIASAQTPQAPIVFFAIAGPNDAKLKAFYASNFGWPIGESNGMTTPGLNGTLREDPAETLIYLGVKDIAGVFSRIVDTGGSVVMPRTVIPNIVTFAIFKDPAGNRVGLVEQK